MNETKEIPGDAALQPLVLLQEAKKEQVWAGARLVRALGLCSEPGLCPVTRGEEQAPGSPPFAGGSWMGSLKHSFLQTALINAIKNTKARRAPATCSFPDASQRRQDEG